jgi:hypothetical protein
MVRQATGPEAQDDILHHPQNGFAEYGCLLEDQPEQLKSRMARRDPKIYVGPKSTPPSRRWASDGLRVSAEAFEQGRVQPRADVIWQWDGFGVAENLDRFARGVHHHAAVAAAGEMLFEVDSDAGVEDAVEIAR